MKRTNFKGEVLEDVMKQKIDLVDRRILYLLSNNCRISDTAIAKTLRTSREVVSYRIKQLMIKKLISGFSTLMDPKKLGFVIYTIFIKLAKIKDEIKIINELNDEKEVTAVLACGGRFDLYLDITLKNAEEFDAFFKRFQEKYGSIIQEFVILNYISESPVGNEALFDENPEEIQRWNNIIERKGSTFHKEFGRKEKDLIIPLDAIDKTILSILKKDAKSTLKDVSQEVNLTPNAVKTRISGYVSSGLIKNFTTLISFQPLGYQWYVVLFNMVGLNEAKFNTYLKTHPNTEWCVKYVGPWNYQISIFAKDNRAFHRVLNQIREEFADNIIAFDSMLVFNQFKFENRID